jgi:N-ethylmaleimide reductase
MVPHVTPRALRLAEIGAVIDGFARATANALEAGFDGVHLHAGTGYLPMQFLATGTNRRHDRYGGDLAGRLRFTLEVTEAMIGVAGAGRVGVRITPESPINDISDDDPVTTFTALARELSARQVAFIDVTATGTATDYHAQLRPAVLGPRYFHGGGLTGDSAEQLVTGGQADAVLFGQLFISNPDLPVRLRRRLPLAVADQATFYSGGARGYIDYPGHRDVAGVAA